MTMNRRRIEERLLAMGTDQPHQWQRADRVQCAPLRNAEYDGRYASGSYTYRAPYLPT